MRVLIINSLFAGGGVDSHSMTLAKALAAAGAEVVLTVSSRGRWLDQARRLPGVRLEVLDAARLAWPFALSRIIRKYGIDITHAHHGRDYWLAVLAAKLRGGSVGVVITRHLMTRMSSKTRRYLGRFATVIAVSDAVARVLAEQDAAHPLPLKVVRCGVDTDVFAPSAAQRAAMRNKFDIPEQVFLFAMVGNVHPPEGKGNFRFAEAAAAVASQVDDAWFLNVGSGELIDELKQRVDALGIAQRFRFIPFSDDLAALMQGIDALVHPAVGSEALGLVILEALSCGKPVVASRLDGIPETFIDGEHGYLVPPRDAAALAEAMIRLASDRGRVAAMGARGRDWIEQGFSLRRLAAETLAVYGETLAGSRR